jgi:lysyl-tRNA synthetase class 2
VASEEELRKERIEKLERWRGAGVDPYPAKTPPAVPIAEARKKKGKIFAVAGRLLARREHGGITFFDLSDFSGKIQLFCQEKALGKWYERLSWLDVGDFVSAKGKVFTTKAGEITVEVSEIQLLAKSLLPLPEKWHGLTDVEERYRARYLDLIANPEVRDLFLKRTRAVQAIREFLDKNAFVEVETPTLQPIPGGASAKPFTTHYNAYDIDVYLRVAPELYLKRLLVGGFERVYEFARVFRNEGVDATHNPESTMLEFYVAYKDYEWLMDFTEDLVITAAKAVRGKAEFEQDGKIIPLKKPFVRKTFAQVTGGKNTDDAFKDAQRKIWEPTFVVDYPLEISPLAKKKDEKSVQRFQLVVAGFEFINAFSELNDPIDQRHRFQEQEKRRRAGDEEAQRLDEDFLRALEHGMPPAAGFGMGIDRLVRLLTGRNALREVILFPFMKPKK